MLNIIRKISALVALLLLCSVSVSAQYHKERRLVREGNSNFERKNFNTSYNRYNEALEHDAMSYEALYNRANAYHHLRKSNPEDSTLTAEVAFRNYEAIAADTLLSAAQRAEVLRNLGESLVEGEKYEAALNAFRKSMLLNPDDAATKYNYVLTKRIVDQKRSAQQQQQQNNQSNDPQQNDQNQQQDNNQQQNNEDQQQNNNNEDQQQNQDQQNEGDQEQDQQQPQPEEGDQNEEQQPQGSEPKELSADQERLLDAIQAEEDKTQEKLKEGEKAIVVRGKKNW